MTWLETRRAYVPLHEQMGTEKYTNSPIITIAGERQTGKTFMVLERAVRHAQEGEIVLYTASHGDSARYHLSTVESFRPEGLYRVRLAAGQQSISFETGGEIHFRPRTENQLRSRPWDVVIFDDFVYTRDAIHLPTVMFTAPKLIYKVVTEE